MAFELPHIDDNDEANNCIKYEIILMGTLHKMSLSLSKKCIKIQHSTAFQQPSIDNS